MVSEQGRLGVGGAAGRETKWKTEWERERWGKGEEWQRFCYFQVRAQPASLGFRDNWMAEKKKHLARDYSRGEWDSHTIMTGKKFDFNKTVTVYVMKVYAVWNILMQVLSVKNDLDLASILHISLLCDKSSLLYQNASLVTLETNKCHSVAEQQLICNKLAFYLHINIFIILRSWLENCGVFLFCYCILKRFFFFYWLQAHNCVFPKNEVNFHWGQFRVSFQSNALHRFSCHFPCTEMVI